MFEKYGLILIDSLLDDVALSEILSIQFDLLYFSSANNFEKLFPQHAGALQMVILDGSATDSVKILTQLNDRACSVPTLVITEEADNERITASQSLSGSDLLFKPFKTGELLYRCEKLLEISHGLKLLPNVVSGIRIPNLTIKERRLLTVFLKIETAVISRNDLFRAVWNSVSVHRKTLDVHLFNLRRKLRLYGFDIVHIQDAYRIQSVDLLENPQVNTLS